MWQADWLATAGSAKRELWRGVEAQHQVATMRLVDDLDEQHLLEQVLESSKPPLPPGVGGLHYLLSTPFRYRSPWPSRFRLPDQPGAWYGADEPATVAAEVAHWRWRFFNDSDGLRDGALVTEHTFFQATFTGTEIDLTAAPWSNCRDAWCHPDDYSSCQALATHIRKTAPAIAAIRYESARLENGMCQVVFEPHTLTRPAPHVQQTWVAKTTARQVMFVHQGETLQFTKP